MHATIRRYEAIDQTCTNEVVKKIQDSLLPRLSEFPGFRGYYLIDASNGVISSVGFFDSAERAEASTGSRPNGCARRTSRGPPESAEDHQRKGTRAQDTRARRGVTASKRCCSASGPAKRALLLR